MSPSDQKSLLYPNTWARLASMLNFVILCVHSEVSERPTHLAPARFPRKEKRSSGSHPGPDLVPNAHRRFLSPARLRRCKPIKKRLFVQGWVFFDWSCVFVCAFVFRLSWCQNATAALTASRGSNWSWTTRRSWRTRVWPAALQTSRPAQVRWQGGVTLLTSPETFRAATLIIWR